MAFNNTFTGKGVYAPIQSGDKVLSAYEGLNAMVTKAEELKYATFQKNRDEFLKNANIDPVFVLSDSARKSQMAMITEFNKKWGKRAQETNYNMSDEDRQNMLTEKNLIVSEAQNQLATMDRFQQHRELVQNNLDKFDDVKFAEATDNYMRTGKYDQTIPAWQPVDFGDYVRSESKKVSGEYDERMISGAYGQIQQETFNIPTGEEGKFIISQLGKNPQADADFWNKWNEADKEKYFKLAEINGDDKTSPEENRNAIALWAKDTFGSQARIRNLTTPKGQTRAGGRTTFDWNIGIGSGHNQNDRFDNQGQQTVASSGGDFVFPDYQNLGRVSQTSETQNIPEVIVKDEKGNEVRKKLNETALFHVVAFSKAKDQLVIQLDGDSSGENTYDKGEILVVPASGFNDLLRSKPFGIYREAPTTPAKSTTTKKRFNYVTGQLEEVTE